MSELLITSSLDPIEEGQVFSEGLPRHVTIWQYFQLPDFHRQAFIEEASEAIEGFSPLEIIGGQEDRFGPNNDVRVRRIETIGKGATLITLHTVLGEMIQRHEGTVRTPEWAFEGYNPHMTYVDGQALDEGEREILTTVELIEKTPPSKDKIVRKIWKLEEA